MRNYVKNEYPNKVLKLNKIIILKYQPKADIWETEFLIAESEFLIGNCWLQGKSAASK